MAEVSYPPQSTNTIDMPSITTRSDSHHAPSSMDTALTTISPSQSDPSIPNPTSPTTGSKTKTLRRVLKPRRRPARPQVDPSTLLTHGAPPPQTGTIFNIWYNKWSGGDREDAYLSKHAAKSRCNIATDTGYTRADKVPGSYFCLFFARGLCPKGHECEYLHRLPGLHDHFNPNVDCFGRDKHSDYRDDMGGVGSFMRQNRTLYAGRITVSDDVEEIVARHFAEWGEVERMRVLSQRGVAFVTYINEAASQFAKEAMAHQSLDSGEVLNVRWATVDPNPLAAKREARAIDEQAAEAVRRALPAEYVAELEGRAVPGTEDRKRRRIEGGFGLDGYQAPDEILLGGGLLALEHNTKSEQTIYESSQEPQIDSTKSILGAGAMQALASYSALTNGRMLSTRPAVAAPQASQNGGGLLVGYGSDDDESE